jgi:magnesium-transporting ATPase (P-type)
MNNTTYSTNADRFFRRKYTPTITITAGILLFLLPFAELKCGSTTIAENTGVGLATGKDWKVSLFGDYGEYLNKESKNINTADKTIINDPNWFIILSLFFAFSAFIFSVSNWSSKNLYTMSAGLLAAILLLAAMIFLKLMFRSEMRSGQDQDFSKISSLIKLQFTVWYYFSLIAFSAAAFFSYKQHQIELQDKIDRTVDFEFQRTGQQPE